MEKIRVGDLGKIVTGKTPKTNISENYGGKIPFLTPTDDLSPMKCQKTINTLTELGLCEVKNCLLPSKSICVSCIGSDMGHVIMTSQPTVTNQQFNSIIPLEEYNPEYVYYLMILLGKLMKSKFGKSSTAVPIVSKSLFSSFEIYVYKDKDRQKAISNVLANIDEKITLNTRMNAELEAMAKQLYDYWFVQFDFPDENGKPYKSSGGKMVYNSTLKRDIPAGWEVNSIINIIEPLERGISYSSEDINKNIGIPMFNLACYSKLGEYRTGELKTFSGYVKSENKTYPYDMLIACTDMTQDADIIGRPILVTEEYHSYVYSMDLIKITPKEIDKFYLYYSLRTPFYHKYIKPFASGTNVKHLKVDGIENYIISIPPAYLQSLFEKIVSNLKKKEMKIINENIDLTHLRDSLLPMLMNGQVTVE